MRYPTTLEGLAQAEAHLESLHARDGSDTSGNPEKYHSRIQDAKVQVALIKDALKVAGVIPYTEIELLSRRLDSLYPDAARDSERVVDGVRYLKQGRPLSTSRSRKTVFIWDTWWTPLGPETADTPASELRAKLNSTLDALHPNAGSRFKATFEGKQYQKRYAPETMSRTGKTVKEWRTWWEEI